MTAKRNPKGLLQGPNERTMLRQLVREFSSEMREKLLAKADAGWGGWDIKIYKKTLEEKLVHHLVRALKGDAKQWVDVANFAAFLWYLESIKTD